MANDTAINSLPSSDSSITAFRKKTKTESIDVSKLSFFDALLSMGQFESIVPHEIGPNTEKRIDSDRRPEDSSTSPPVDSANSREEDSEVDSQAAQSQVVVPLATPLQSSDLGKTVERQPSDANQATEPQNRIQPEGEPVVSSQSQLGDSGIEGAKSVLDTGTEDSLTPTIGKDLSPLAAENTTSNGADLEPVGSDGEARSSAPQELSPLKPIQKSGASPNSSDADPSQSGQGKRQAVSKPERTSASIESNKEQSDENKFEVSEKRPRNKRAEHLAQRASESAPVSNNPDPSTSSLLATESDTPKGQTDAPTDPSAVAGTSLPSSSTPIPSSLAPAIASPSALSGNMTSTSPSLRPNNEVISAVGTATARGGIQTETSNTSYTGAVSNPGRSEPSRGEVARSNSGTQISAYQEVKLVQRVLRGVEQLANGGGQVRLRLHPPELGSLQMSLRMEAGQVFAKLEVENFTARDALLNNVQTLKDRMAEQGMSVAAFEVEVSTDSSGSGTAGSTMQRDGGSGSQSRWENATSRFAQQNNNRISPEPGQAERMPGAAWTRTNGSLDLTV